MASCKEPHFLGHDQITTNLLTDTEDSIPPHILFLTLFCHRKNEILHPWSSNHSVGRCLAHVQHVNIDFPCSLILGSAWFRRFYSPIQCSLSKHVSVAVQGKCERSSWLSRFAVNPRARHPRRTLIQYFSKCCWNEPWSFSHSPSTVGHHWASWTISFFLGATSSDLPDRQRASIT